MRVFVTGATGFIGSAVVRDLLAAGHDVLGLARSDAGAEALTAAGAQVHRGDLDDPASLRAGAAAADGVIHLAYRHDFGDFAGNAALDLRAVREIGAELEGTDKPLVIASGTLLLVTLAPGRLGTEDILPPADTTVPRAASEAAVLELAKRGVRSSAVRLAPTVHGEADKGFMARFVAIAREKGASAYVGDGSSRWPAVHRYDAARLFRLAAESAPAGTVLHATGEQGIPFREIAETIGRNVGVPAVSVAAAEAAEHLGFLGPLAALDNPTSSEATRKLLDWTPSHPGLLADLEAHYFA